MTIYTKNWRYMACWAPPGYAYGNNLS